MKRRIPLLLLVACTPGLLFSPPAQAQSSCASALEEAGASFRMGLVARTVDLLTPCLPDGFADRSQAVEAHRLMALSYFALDRFDEMDAWVRRLTRISPGYRARPDEDPLLFGTLVDRYRPKWYNNRWLWAGGSAVALGVGGFLLTRDTSGPEPLPDPGTFFPQGP